MSTYFDESLNRIATGALARSTHVNGFKDSVGAAFDMLTEPTEISQGTSTLGVESGAADAYVLTMPKTLVAYTTGNEIVFVPGNTNTGASVVNVDGLGNVGLKRANGDDLSAGDLVAGSVYSFRHNGSAYQFISFSTTEAGAIAAAASASAASASASASAASAAAALVSENNAETAETNAETAETNAETAETNAETAETNAAASAASIADAVTDYESMMYFYSMF